MVNNKFNNRNDFYSSFIIRSFEVTIYLSIAVLIDVLACSHIYVIYLSIDEI